MKRQNRQEQNLETHLFKVMEIDVFLRYFVIEVFNFENFQNVVLLKCI